MTTIESQRTATNILRIGIMCIAVLVIVLSLTIILAYHYAPEQVEPTLYYQIRAGKNFGGIYTFSPYTGTIRTLLSPTGEFGYETVAPSSDGSRFVFQYNMDLWVNNIVTHNSRRATNNDESLFEMPYAISVSWSPDDRFFAYQLTYSDETRNGIWVATGDGTKVHKVKGTEDTGFNGWISNQRIEVYSDRPEGKGLYSVSIDGSTWDWLGTEEAVVPESGQIENYWAPDNQHHITVVNGTTVTLYTKKESQGGKDIPLDTPFLRLSGIDWSPDSNWVYLQIAYQPDKNIPGYYESAYLMSSDGNSLTNLRNEIFNFADETTKVTIYSYGWSPDGSYLVFSQHPVDRTYLATDFGYYIYSTQTHELYATPFGGVIDALGWWPMIKQGPLGLPISLVRPLVTNRNDLIVTLICGVLVLITLAWAYQFCRGRSYVENDSQS